MLTVADVKCYHCGFISGEISVEYGQPLRTGMFKPTTNCSAEQIVHGGKLRCCRCAGPVYLDDVRTVRPRPVYTDVRPRRGRPRRAEVLARAS